MPTIINADAVSWALAYDGPLFHGLLCDPPYHLHNGDPNAKTGFMGKAFDGGDVAFRADTWAAFARVLHPGAFLMAFASSRGWHRMACAIEDAGYIIHPTIFLWSYGQGFPKATRVLSVSPDFAGHRYGLQALKPAAEPIIVAQKPYQGRPVDCITRTGAGALWIDGGRIGTDKRIFSSGLGDNRNLNDDNWNGIGKRTEEREHIGRWPANFILSHLPECRMVGQRRVSGRGAYPKDVVPNNPLQFTSEQHRDERVEIGEETIDAWECAPGCAVKALGEQGYAAGAHSPGLKNPSYQPAGKYTDTAIYFSDIGRKPFDYGDEGAVSRFFFNSDYTLDALENADPVFYCAKASRAERDAGLDGWAERYSGDGRKNGKPHGMDNLHGQPARNSHPTLKPLKLTRHLATLLLPPAAYAPRRLFVPFAGAGSEMIGASLAGWEEITGVEMEAEYVEIAQARLRHWAGYTPPTESIIARPTVTNDGPAQGRLF